MPDKILEQISQRELLHGRQRIVMDPFKSPCYNTNTKTSNTKALAKCQLHRNNHLTRRLDIDKKRRRGIVRFDEVKEDFFPGGFFTLNWSF